MQDSVVLVSGGTDSVTLLHYAVKEMELDPFVLSFFYGQKHARELECARWQADKLGLEHRTVNLNDHVSKLKSALTRAAKMPSASDVEGDEQPATYVPFRNTLLLAAACGLAESIGVGVVCYGPQKRDEGGYWDCTPEFVEHFQHLCNLNRAHKIQLSAPFVNKSKTEVIGIGHKLGVDFSKTWTCYEGGSEPCEVCPTCDERSIAFAQAGLVDPLIPGRAKG